jgi:cobalt-zinc-cadmium efflux system outer membrane protein
MFLIMIHKNSITTAIQRSFILFLFLIALPPDSLGKSRGPGGGEETAPDGTGREEIRVTWQDILTLAQNHPRIGAGQQGAEAARAGIKAAGAVPNPSLEASAAYGVARDHSTAKWEWGLALSIPLDWMASRRANINAAQGEANSALGEASAIRREVISQLRIMFWTLVYEQERVVALGELYDQMTALETTVKRRVEKGEVRPVEAIRVSVEVETLKGELEVVQLELDAIGIQLATWLGTKGNGKLVAVGNLTQLPNPISAHLARAKVGEHPTIEAARGRVKSLAANVVAARRERAPAMDLEIFTDHELDRRAYGVGLAIDLPLWNWNKGGVKQSEHLLTAQRSLLEARRLELETLAIETQTKCRAAVLLASHYRDSILPRAESVAQVIERTYQLGEASLLEVIDARQTLIETRNRFLSSLAKAQMDCSRLDALVGEEYQ